MGGEEETEATRARWDWAESRGEGGCWSDDGCASFESFAVIFGENVRRAASSCGVYCGAPVVADRCRVSGGWGLLAAERALTRARMSGDFDGEVDRGVLVALLTDAALLTAELETTDDGFVRALLFTFAFGLNVGDGEDT